MHMHASYIFFLDYQNDNHLFDGTWLAAIPGNYYCSLIIFSIKYVGCYNLILYSDHLIEKKTCASISTDKHFFLQQLSKSHNRYCQEAVNSIKDVERCPTSKSEWERAAYIKNCTELALRQNCVSTNKFKYHCAINGRRNKLVEVCAPERIILGIF